METRRLEKINELIHRFISELIKRELDVDALVTVSNVSTSANGQETTIGITVFPYSKSTDILGELRKNLYEFQKKLNRGLRMRPVPKMIFEIDESEEKGGRVLDSIKKVAGN